MKASKKRVKKTAATTTRQAAVQLTDQTKVYRTSSKRNKKGQKQLLLEMVPKSGISISKLTRKAKSEKLPAGKVVPWIKFFRRFHHIDVRS